MQRYRCIVSQRTKVRFANSTRKTQLRKKILLVTQDYGPQTIGGEGVVAMQLAEELILSGHDVDVVCPCQPGAEAFDSGQTHRIMRVPTHGDDFVRRTLSFWLSCRDCIRAFNGDIVYYLRPAPFRTDCTSVYHYHLLRRSLALACFRQRKYFTGAANLAFSLFDKFYARRASRVVALTDTMKSELVNYYHIAPDQTSVLPNKMDLNQWRFSPFGADRTRQILYVGRLDEAKGPMDLLNACTPILRNHPEYTLLFVGQGALERRLKTEALASKVGAQVRFAGQVERNELVDFYHQSQLVVVPSHYESFGMVLVEAMASGTPVLSSDACIDLGQPRFPTGKVKLLRRAIEDLIDDHATLESLSFACRDELDAMQRHRSSTGVSKIIEELS